MEREQFVSEALDPIFDDAAGDDTLVVVGEPVLPNAFRWRGSVYPVLRVLERGKSLGPCTHGSGERYVRRHWYRLQSTGGLVLRVYFERRPVRGRRAAKRWWLFATEADQAAARSAGAPSDPGGKRK